MLALIKRELKTRYARTYFGLLWSFMKPLSYLTVYGLFYFMLIGKDKAHIPYLLNILPGIVAWQFFTDTIHQAGQALNLDIALKKKNYIPGLVLVMYRFFISSIDLVVGLLLCLLLMLYFHKENYLCLLMMPLAVLFHLTASLAFVFWTNILSIKSKDMLQFFMTFLGFAWWFTPVIYSPELVPEIFRNVMYINPMAGVIGIYRWAITGEAITSPWYLCGFILMLLMFFSGLFIFLKLDKDAVDIL